MLSRSHDASDWIEDCYFPNAILRSMCAAVVDDREMTN